MTKIKDIYNYINNIAPFEDAENWDNVGLLVGNMEYDVSKVLVALDLSKAVLEQAVNESVGLIVCHHPVIFKPLAKIELGGMLSILIAHNISVICAHTNLDVAEYGVNFCLGKALNLKNARSLKNELGFFCGLLGELAEELEQSEFLEKVSNSLGIDVLKHYFPDGKKIKTVACSSGSGAFMLQDAVAAKADVLVTGDVKHSSWYEAEANIIGLVDAGHFNTENIVIPELVRQIKSEFKGVSCKEATHNVAIYNFWSKRNCDL